MTDRKLEVRPNRICIEGTPLQQSRFDRAMSEADYEIEAWRDFIRGTSEAPEQ